MNIKVSRFKGATTRAAMCSMLKRDLAKVKDKRVLEIGCGSWDYAKNILERNGCSWFGIEPIDLGKNNLTFLRGSVGDLPLHNETFDLVLCNQSMEHWFEYGVSFDEALKEINRVLKPNGTLMINVPIHIHGHPIFLRGNMKKIKNIFAKDMWSFVLFERCIPSEDHLGWRKIGISGWQSKVGYPSWFMPNHKKAFSHILNIHVKKINRTSVRSLANSEYRQFVVITRFIKEMILGRL
ncbi:MAG: class I SAM-dependent methyltransferase [Candidatus Nanoarchaeia archaeon]